MPEKEVMNVEEAARFLGFAPYTIREKARNGEIPGRKVGREWRFLRPEIRAWLRAAWRKRDLMPEKGVAFNAADPPPAEYLMRRSYNANDVDIPGAVLRETRCDNGHGPHDARIYPPLKTCYRCKVEGREGSLDRVYSVDVPLIKENGERWR